MSGNSASCGSHDDGDFIAGTMCCACGGGIGGVTTYTNVNDASVLASYMGTPKTYALRWAHSSGGSQMGDDGDGHFYDYFTVTITYECDSDELQLQVDIADQTYSLDAASALTVLSNTNTALTNSNRNTNCPYTMTCEKWDTSVNTWTAITIASPGVTCVDSTSNSDSSSNTCADYAANMDDSSILTCDGSRD